MGRVLSGMAFHSFIWAMRVSASFRNWLSVISLITANSIAHSPKIARIILKKIKIYF